jgi:hypothetical protein
MTPRGVTPFANHNCPVCGQPNDCAPARSGTFATPCWCAAVTVEASALEAVPYEQRNRACLCANCLAEIHSVTK